MAPEHRPRCHQIGEESRKRRGLTQQELARSSGVSLSLVRKVEQGDYDNGLPLEAGERWPSRCRCRHPRWR
jgi:predicted transcriptional regulator